MGLESHIYSVLDNKDYPRTKYYFEFGLKADSEQDAKDIADILNESGEFGQAEVFWQGGLDVWGVKFGKYKER